MLDFNGCLHDESLVTSHETEPHWITVQGIAPRSMLYASNNLTLMDAVIHEETREVAPVYHDIMTEHQVGFKPTGRAHVRISFAFWGGWFVQLTWAVDHTGVPDEKWIIWQEGNNTSSKSSAATQKMIEEIRRTKLYKTLSDGWLSILHTKDTI